MSKKFNVGSVLYASVDNSRDYYSSKLTHGNGDEKRPGGSLNCQKPGRYNCSNEWLVQAGSQVGLIQQLWIWLAECSILRSKRDGQKQRYYSTCTIRRNQGWLIRRLRATVPIKLHDLLLSY